MLLRGPDDIVKLARSFGRSFFEVKTAVRAVHINAGKCLEAGFDNARVALCCRELLVAALLAIMQNPKTNWAAVDKYKLWTNKWATVIQKRYDAYKTLNSKDEQRWMQLVQAQELAAISAIVEGAVARCMQLADRSSKMARDNAQIIAACAVVGITAGLTASHVGAVLLVVVPAMIQIVATQVIDRNYPVTHHARHAQNMRLQRIAQMQSVYVARFRGGRIPTAEDFVDIRNVVDLYQKAESAVSGLFAVSA